MIMFENELPACSLPMEVRNYTHLGITWATFCSLDRLEIHMSDGRVFLMKDRVVGRHGFVWKEKTRAEIAAFVKGQFETGVDSSKKGHRFHYGKNELKELMDFIYGSTPFDETERLSFKTNRA